MLLAISLVLAITGLAWSINKLLPFKICPVCAGVSGTWFVLTALMLNGTLPTIEYLLIGMPNGTPPMVGYLFPTAILMGGTVVGIAYYGEKIFKWPANHPVSWKLICIVIGFPLVSFVIRNMSWKALFAEAVFMAVLSYVFFMRKSLQGATKRGHAEDSPAMRDIEKKLDKCC